MTPSFYRYLCRYRTQWGICVGICLCAVRTLPHNFVQIIFIGVRMGLNVGQCELTISPDGKVQVPLMVESRALVNVGRTVLNTKMP